MSYKLAEQLQLESAAVSQPLSATALDSRLMCCVTHQTTPVTLSFKDCHTERLSFYLYHSTHHPLILGYPWLKLHNPPIDWSTGKLLSWGIGCRENCVPPRHTLDPATDKNRSIENPDLTGVPNFYWDLKEGFSKSKATSLPPHRAYDCVIDLLPGAAIPTGRLYSLSGPEQQVMEEYISSSLQAGIIWPSSSPAGAGFFFVEKKDKSLRPCIDYTGLNDITVKNRYPLPLISSAFDQLQDAKVFTKLDLRNAYHLVKIREGEEWKTAFNTPIGQYEYLVMPFGLTNAPAVFQALINDVLRDMLNRTVFVYLDDILIFSPDLHSHVQVVRKVLLRHLEHKLFVKAENVSFAAPQCLS